MWGQWWRTTDRLFFTLVMLLITVGAVLVMAASPAIADKHNLPAFYFTQRQFGFLGVGIVLMIALSFCPPKFIRRLSVLGCVTVLLLMVAVLLIGDEVKGATRWINLGFFSLQPSELMKPFFVVVVAWLLAKQQNSRSLLNYRAPFLLYALVVALLLLQPDVGMTITFTFAFGALLFVGGLPIRYVVIAGVLALGSLFLAYESFSHVRERIDGFLKPEQGENYQVEKSIEAFQSGGIFGRGPGEGVVKQHLPDSHTDFIFSVAGEEFGIFICILIVALYAAIVIRGFWRIYQQQDRFHILAVCGLLIVFGFQAFVNMGVAVRLLPAKGMTLPFISYGGSSILASAMMMGMVLALTRRQVKVG